jgi:hypothetical protein
MRQPARRRTGSDSAISGEAGRVTPVTFQERT